MVDIKQTKDSHQYEEMNMKYTKIKPIEVFFYALRTKRKELNRCKLPCVSIYIHIYMCAVLPLSLSLSVLSICFFHLFYINTHITIVWGMMHASAVCSNCLRANELYLPYGINTHTHTFMHANDTVDFFFVFNALSYMPQSNKTMAVENKWAHLHYFNVAIEIKFPV